VLVTPPPSAAPTHAPTYGPAPVLDLIGEDVMYMEATTHGWKEPGATCTDAEYGDISANVYVGSNDEASVSVDTQAGSNDGHVDTWVSGVYTLRYSCCNRDHQCAPEMVRIVVVKDRTCPVCDFKLYKGLPGDDIAIEASFPYTEPGGLDCRDNSRTPEQLANSTVTTCSAVAPAACVENQPDTDTPGTYYMTYRVQDANGHWNDDPECGDVHPLVRTVTVTDTLKPVIALRYKEAGFLGTKDSGAETSSVTWSVNPARKKYTDSEQEWTNMHAEPSFMAETGAPSSVSWLLVGATSAIGLVVFAAVQFTRQRRSRLPMSMTVPV